MQIQCPHCKSRYRLGAEVIDAYGGFVRCGNCNYKFNIHDQVILDDGQSGLVNTETRPSRDTIGVKPDEANSTTERIEPRLEQDESEEEYNIRFGPDEDQIKTGDSSSAGSEAREPLLEPSEPDSENDSSDTFHYSVAIDELDPLLDMDDDYDLTDTEEPPGKSDYNVYEPATTTSVRPPFDEHEESLVFESLPSDDIEEDSSRIVLTNDDVEKHEPQPEAGLSSLLFFMVWGAIRFVFWTVAAIALAYLLFGQLKETLYPAYKNNPTVQQVRAAVCEYLPCDESKVNIDLFEIVVSRMDEINQPERQLHVSIFLLNRAEYAQAYPNILLTLKTIDGSTIGQRVISPEEYFTSYDSLISSPASLSSVDGTLVKPNKLGKILIKLKAPPSAAVGFEARVVR